MKSYMVYMHVSPSGKRYIGITSNSSMCRWGKTGNGYKTQQYFYRAIEKYGWDNFEHIIIAKGLDKETAKWLEIELIREWDTTDKNKGYNLSPGGDIPTEYAIEKRCRPIICVTTNKKFNSAKEASEFYNCDGSSIIKCCKNNKNNNYCGELLDGTKLVWMYLEDYKNLSKEDIKEIKEKVERKIICITTGEIFNSLKIAQDETNVPESNICKCCKGKRRFAGELPDGIKLVWMYLEDYEKSSKIDIENKISKAYEGKNILKGKDLPQSRAIICITTGKIFDTAKEAGQYYNCSNSSIGECCKGKRKTTGRLADGTKLQWAYLDGNGGVI